jgi:hypothetical protein
MVVFQQIKLFVKYPESVVSWSLAFAVHCILTAVFEVQGSNHLNFIAETCRSSFDAFIGQLKWCDETRPTIIPQRRPTWESNMRALLVLRYLVHAPVERTEKQNVLSIWNPLCAGVFLTYVAYYGNLERGTCLIDSVAQLRTTLHLFNALRQAKAVQPGQIKLMDWIFDVFQNSKAIWEGPLPTRGQYRTRYGNRTRTPVTPQTLSKSYRRICLRDFDGVVDKHHNPSARDHARNGKFFACRTCQ